MNDNPETNPRPAAFDPSQYPEDSLFHERRSGKDRRQPAPEEQAQPAPEPSNRRRKDRRRRVDPTTFEKQYTAEEIEFMNAMQRFKVQSGKAFPTHREVLQVALSLGYRQIEDLAELDPDS